MHDFAPFSRKITPPWKPSFPHGIKNPKRVFFDASRKSSILPSHIKISSFRSNRLGLPDFFAKYPTYNQASDRIFAILGERSVERENFWRERFQNIINDNRLKDLADRFQARRAEFIKRLLDRAEPLLDRFLPKVDQANIDKRIADYVAKLVNGFEQVLKRNTEQWKNVFKAIDEASKGEDTKWFRTLVADINSNEFAAQTDAEVAKVIKKLGDSSKLLISNIQQISRGMTKRQESIRERVRNAIRHMPNVSPFVCPFSSHALIVLMFFRPISMILILNC